MTDKGFELLENFNELLEKEIRKVVMQGEIKPDQYQNLERVVCMMKQTKEAEYYMDALGEMEDYGHSTRRGRSMTTGRYVSRTSPMHHHMDDRSMSYMDGYSMHSYKDRIIADLEENVRNAPTEKDRLFAERLLNSAENGMK